MGPIYALYLFVGLFMVLLLREIHQVIQSAFVSPLRHIPGPWWAGVTGLPQIYQVAIRRRAAQWNHEMHLRYGPYVRVGPNEVLIADINAYRQIHRINTPFLKSKFYAYLNVSEPGQGPFGVFQELDPVRHGQRRRLYAKGFSLKSLRAEWEPVVVHGASKAVQRIKEEAAAAGQVDMLKWWSIMAGDIISEVMFGDSFNGLETGKINEFFTAIGQIITGHMIALASPLLHEILRRIPNPKWYMHFQGYKDIRAVAQVAVTNSRSTAGTRNIFTGVLEQAEIDKNSSDYTQAPPVTDEEIATQASSFIIAGTDTTANTLSYLIWAILKDQTGLQAAIEAEVAGLDADFSDEQVAALPLLNAAISEGLRLYPAVPAPLPRAAPLGGHHFGGYFFPAGTILLSQAYTMHRDPEVFTDPEKYDFHRWLKGNAAYLNTYSMGFGSGSRVCIGIHLAMMELRLGSAQFFRNCRGAKIAPTTTAETMEMENTFLMSPVGHRNEVVLPRLG